jgi:hypothetical protein
MLTPADIKQLSTTFRKELKKEMDETRKEADDFLTLREVAQRFEIGMPAVRKRCRQGKLPYSIKNGKYYFSKRAITNYFLEQ